MAFLNISITVNRNRGETKDLRANKKIETNFKASSFLQTEWHTLWQKADGTTYEKITKYKPTNRYDFPNGFNPYIYIGFINDYGHKVISCREQLKFIL
jgi:hypothetical protein